MRREIVLGLAALLLSLQGVLADAGGVKLIPSPEGVYTSAYPDFTDTEDHVTAESITKFQTLTGKLVVWVYFSNNWFDGIRFPAEAVQTIHDLGLIPFIRLMPRSSDDEYVEEPMYTVENILAGQFDDNLRQWAREARDTHIPLLVEFGTEVNGEWFPWNGVYHGANETDGYGDPTQADGPERFRDVYRHVVTLFREEGADNLTWFYHVNGDSQPEEDWNSMAAYYPGDDYVDWIGVSVYGALNPGDEWTEFTDSMDIAYPELAAISPNKPLALLEFGVVADPTIGDKAEWIRAALDAVAARRYPRIKAVSYWNEEWENEDGSISNLRLDSSPEVTATYRDIIASPFFVAQPYFDNGG
jgi:glycosyl hydrolase family 26